MRTSKLTQIVGAAGIFSIAGLVLLASGCSPAEPGTYATPEEAVQALGELVGSGDDKRAEEMFGPGCMDLFRSGDPVADKQEAQRVKALIAEKVGIGDVDGTARVAVLGNDEWPFPIPIVPAGKRWRFDTAAGREELLNRRIGENELYTLASLHAYVDAQFEYHATGHDGLAPAFAQRVRSTEGKQDGLFWEAAEEEELSPLGDLLAGAEAIVPPQPQPFHGYNYRILKAQGKNAPGGEQNYLNAKGAMTGGFAAVAWPAKYGNAGVMTFVVNHRDIVFQKDLGAETEQVASAMTAFDPDVTWEATGESIEMVEDEGEAEAGTEGEEGTEAEAGTEGAAAKGGS